MRQAHDHQPRPHEPARRSTRRSTLAEASNYSGRDLAARLDGPGQLAADLEARRRRLPGPQLGDRATSRSTSSTGRERTPVQDRLGLRRRPRRPLRAARRPRAAITYPFKSYDGKVTFDRQRTGERTFDYSNEGVAHYGLYADWFEDLRRSGRREHRSATCGRRGGLPPDVGARRRHPRGGLPCRAARGSRRKGLGELRLGAGTRSC